jgi:hypothetical protein
VAKVGANADLNKDQFRELLSEVKQSSLTAAQELQVEALGELCVGPSPADEPHHLHSNYFVVSLFYSFTTLRRFWSLTRTAPTTTATATQRQQLEQHSNCMFICFLGSSWLKLPQVERDGGELQCLLIETERIVAGDTFEKRWIL